MVTHTQTKLEWLEDLDGAQCQANGFRAQITLTIPATTGEGGILA